MSDGNEGDNKAAVMDFVDNPVITDADAARERVRSEPIMTRYVKARQGHLLFRRASALQAEGISKPAGTEDQPCREVATLV